MAIQQIIRKSDSRLVVNSINRKTWVSKDVINLVEGVSEIFLFLTRKKRYRHEVTST